MCLFHVVRAFALIVLTCLHLAFGEPLAPASQSAQKLEGTQAYAALVAVAPASAKVVHQSRTYVLAPSAGNSALPGGWNGVFERKTITLANGLTVSVIDPQKIVISRGAQATAPNAVQNLADLPPRVRAIVQALQSLDLKVDVERPAMVGYSCYVVSDWVQFKAKRMKEPGASAFMTSVSLMEPEPGQPNYVSTRIPLQPRHAETAFYLHPGWNAIMRYEREANDTLLLWPFQGKQYLLTMAGVNASSGDLLLQVVANTLDSMPAELETDPSIKDLYARIRPRHPLLSAQSCRDTTNWARRIAAALDGIPRSAQTVTPQPASTTTSSVQAVASASQIPVTNELPQRVAATTSNLPNQTSLVTLRRILTPRVRTPITGRIKRWFGEKMEGYRRRPRTAIGDTLFVGGAYLIAQGVFLSNPLSCGIGAVLWAGGYGAYHSPRGPTKPPEHPAVTEARQKIDEYQEQWKRGFTDQELGDLGIFLERFKDMSPQERMQSYKDADVEFTNRLEVLIQMKQNGAGLNYLLY
jgi:hypothetical protein